MRNNRMIYFIFLIIVGLLAASFVYRVFIGVLIVLLLFINRDIISRIFRHLKKMFQQNKEKNSLKSIKISFLILANTVSLNWLVPITVFALYKKIFLFVRSGSEVSLEFFASDRLRENHDCFWFLFIGAKSMDEYVLNLKWNSVRGKRFSRLDQLICLSFDFIGLHSLSRRS